MHKMVAILRSLRDESGASAIEYALVALLLVVAIIGAVILLGSALNELFATVAHRVNQVAPRP